MRYLARAALAAVFLVCGLALVAQAGQALRNVRGMMCDTAAEIDAMYQGTVIEGRPGIAVMLKINYDAGNPTACGNILAPAFLQMRDVRLRRKRFHDGRTWYFYAGIAVAVFTPEEGLRALVHPVRQYFVSFSPFEPGDAESSS